MMKTNGKVAVIAIAAALLMACVARREPPDPRGVSFPLRGDAYRKDGIVIAPETVSLVRPGLDKDQVRQLLGAPHFTEGLFFVHDWNYLIKLPHDDAWRECQLQVQFDAHDRVRASYWRDAGCEVAAPVAQAGASARADDAVDAASGQPENAPETATAEQTVSPTPGPTLELRFPFGHSQIGDLRRDDRERLYALAAQIGARAAQVRRIEIVGHADRLGSPARKSRRGLARAQAVAQVFAGSGIDPRRIDVVGRSDQEPVTRCAETADSTALRACLAPDRRVAVAVFW
jgi:OOP family OmpA-OmpF porin